VAPSSRRSTDDMKSASGALTFAHEKRTTGQPARLDGPFCYGTGKLETGTHRPGDLEQRLGRHASRRVERCGTAVAVNPDAELRRWAASATP
jgi:hypothetical protein